MSRGILSESARDEAEFSFEAEAERYTAKAVLLDFGGDEAVWFPLSLTVGNDDGTWTCPRWLAEKKGVV